MQAKSKYPSMMKPKKRQKLSKLMIQGKDSPYDRTNKQIGLLATDNTYFCVYGYN
ncbi:MAG: hypothetical protein ACI81A_001792 [Paraglaciecola sp.]|jgi:hypothetical protein